MTFLPGFELALTGIDNDPSGDDFYTPGWLLEIVGEIGLDPCYAVGSLVQAAQTFDIRRGEDGLEREWNGEGIVYANCPFSETSAWLAKASRQADRWRRIVVVLCPAVPGDGPWVKHVWPHAVAVGFVQGRVEFVAPDGKLMEKGRGHALVVYGPYDAATAWIDAANERGQRFAQAPVWVQQRKIIDDLPW